MSDPATLISWNVNGIRSVLKKGFGDFLAAEAPDVLCVQESRALPEQVNLETPGYRQFWNPAERKGYAGTLTLSRVEPLSVSTGVGVEELDTEGRVLTLEFEGYWLVNVYTPNSGEKLARLDYRTATWDAAFLAHLKTLERTKPVVFCGDLNVAHKEIDLADPAGNEQSAGFTPAERAGFDRIVASGFIDTFRHFCDEGGRYTWWSYRTGARARNVGWRIDYFCVSESLRGRLAEAGILSDVIGSDHCPVKLVLT